YPHFEGQKRDTPVGRGRGTTRPTPAASPCRTVGGSSSRRSRPPSLSDPVISRENHVTSPSEPIDEAEKTTGRREDRKRKDQNSSCLPVFLSKFSAKMAHSRETGSYRTAPRSCRAAPRSCRAAPRFYRAVRRFYRIAPRFYRVGPRFYLTGRDHGRDSDDRPRPRRATRTLPWREPFYRTSGGAKRSYSSPQK